MVASIKTQQKRDQKERELSAYEMSIRLVEQDVHNRKIEFKTKLDHYQIWKKDNNVEGIKY